MSLLEEYLQPLGVVSQFGGSINVLVLNTTFYVIIISYKYLHWQIYIHK